MAEQAEGAGVTGVAQWSPARIYLVASGIFLLVIAAAGFAINTSFPTSPDAVASDDHVFGILETNGWHNLAGLLSGGLALGFAMRPEWSRFGAMFKGVFYVIVTTSIAIWGGDTFLIASNTADQVVHGTLGITGIAAALATPRVNSP